MSMKAMSVNKRDEDKSVDEGDVCEWRRWMSMKEISVGEGDECGWRI